MNVNPADLRTILGSHGYVFCDDEPEEDVDGEEDTSNAEHELESLIETSVVASSVDHHDQSIENTLQDDLTFWSSTGTVPQEHSTVEEFLTFRMKSALNEVKAVSVVVFRAMFQWGNPIYPPISMAIYTGYDKDNLQRASKDFKIRANEQPQRFSLTSRNQALGKYVQFRFKGKRQLQHQDQQHYLAIRHVQAFGTTLSCANFSLLARHLQTDGMWPATCVTPIMLAHHHVSNIMKLADCSVQHANNEDDKWWENGSIPVDTTVFDINDTS